MRKAVLVTAIILIVILMEPIAQVAVVEANFLLKPSVNIQSPVYYRSKIYQTPTVDVSVYVRNSGSSEITKIFYSVDGKPNATLNIIQNTYNVEYLATGTLENLTDGYHFLRAYSLDTNDIEMSASQTFLVNTTFTYPTFLVSPLNITYSTNEVPLTYTIREKYTIAYLLDDSQSYNVTASNTTLTGLSEGQHRIMVKAVDGFSLYSEQTTYFSVNTTKNIEPSTLNNLENTLPTVIIAVVTGVLLTILLVTGYKRRKHLAADKVFSSLVKKP